MIVNFQIINSLPHQKLNFLNRKYRNYFFNNSFIFDNRFRKKKEVSLKMGAIIIFGISIPFTLFLIFLTFNYIWEKCVYGLIIIIYGCYLMLETRLIMSKGRLNLQSNDHLMDLYCYMVLCYNLQQEYLIFYQKFLEGAHLMKNIINKIIS